MARPSLPNLPRAAVSAFGVYIHFPYCAQRCPYCDFAIAVRRTIRHDRYLGAIQRELAAKAPLYAGRRAVSVYFGGGTPSLWRPDCIASALSSALAAFPPPAGCTPEVTVECDPAELSARTAGDAARDRLTALRGAGVTRLSLGAQSFTPRHLTALGRRHQPEDIVAAVAAARAAGFANLSIDLMIGLPEQTPAELQADLQALLALQPEHVSLYLLTVEPRTPLAAAIRRGAAPGVDPDAQAGAYEQVRQVLTTSGFRHYEISNFARRDAGRDYASVHNRLYWTGGEYLGLGVGAHSFRRQPPSRDEHPAGSGQRFANLRGIDPYLAVWGAESDLVPLAPPLLPKPPPPPHPPLAAGPPTPRPPLAADPPSPRPPLAADPPSPRPPLADDFPPKPPSPARGRLTPKPPSPARGRPTKPPSPARGRLTPQPPSPARGRLTLQPPSPAGGGLTGGWAPSTVHLSSGNLWTALAGASAL